MTQTPTTNAIEVTRPLARWVVNFPAASIPETVKYEGVRTTLNWLGCAIGARPMKRWTGRLAR